MELKVKGYIYNIYLTTYSKRKVRKCSKDKLFDCLRVQITEVHHCEV